MKEWGVFENATASLVEKSIEFAGRVWKPNRKLAYVKASLCHPLPVANSKQRGFTAATLANSFESAVLQMADFEHQLEYYGAESDAICGVIAAAEFPKKKKAMELAAAGEKVPLNVLFAVWRKAKGVEAALEEMASKDNPWRTSMEAEWPQHESALFDGEKIIPWSDCTADMKNLVKPNKVEKYEGKKMLLLMGGEDGNVLLTGGAFTKYPADKNTDLDQIAASDRPDQEKSPKLISMGWKSAEDWRMAQAVASDKTVIVQEKASIVIGTTAPAEDGHVHEITQNLDILITDGHTHYFKPMNFDPAKGTLEGVTSAFGWYDSRMNRYVDHAHKVQLGGTAASVAAAGKTAAISMPPVTPDDFKKGSAR